MPKSDALLGKNIPFVEAYHVGGKQRPTAIVLRTSFTTSDGGAANGIAQAWHNPNNRVDACHYVIDDRQIIRCVPDKQVARSLYTSNYKNAINVNICYDPPNGPSHHILDRTAKQVARLCKLHRIRLRILDKEQELAWVNHPWKYRGGILIKTAGDFPTAKFLSYVEDAYEDF